MHYYPGRDIRDIFDPDSGMTPKVALALIDGLPVGSNFEASQRGGRKFRGWNEDRYLNVMIANSLQSLLFSFVCANVDDKTRRKMQNDRPEPYPIPDSPESMKKAKKDDAHKAGSFAAMVAQAQANKARKQLQQQGE